MHRIASTLTLTQPHLLFLTRLLLCTLPHRPVGVDFLTCFFLFSFFPSSQKGEVSLPSRATQPIAPSTPQREERHKKRTQADGDYVTQPIAWCRGALAFPFLRIGAVCVSLVGAVGSLRKGKGREGKTIRDRRMYAMHGERVYVWTCW